MRKKALRLREQGYKIGMAMFGQTLFTVVKEHDVAAVVDLMNPPSAGDVIVAGISPTGARLA